MMFGVQPPVCRRLRTNAHTSSVCTGYTKIIHIKYKYMDKRKGSIYFSAPKNGSATKDP